MLRIPKISVLESNADEEGKQSTQLFSEDKGRTDDETVYQQSMSFNTSVTKTSPPSLNSKGKLMKLQVQCS
jgi:hypothetical protein